eukprot:TRINITY_DN4475_c0_g1_i2.p1 TRINITY_DN4475_c0_g1~~TRINITY_DN4475_c0_g1_i2.p1  ORF type:complete len:158 (-),score=19.17 TRINITY_DN4475_c0_g1_i2:156-629(-)
MNEITDGAIGIMLIMTLLMLIFFSIHTCLTNKRSSQLLFDWHFHTWLCILGFCFTATFVLAYLVSGASNKFIHGVLDLLLRSIRTPELQIVYLTASITSFLFLYGGQILSYAVANDTVQIYRNQQKEAGPQIDQRPIYEQNSSGSEEELDDYPHQDQ